MAIPRLLRTEQFRYALAAAIVFAVLGSVLGGLLYYGVRDGMERQLREYITAETSQLMGDYGDQGLDELRHDISERVERNPAPRMLYVIESPSGQRIFDRLDLPEAAGWSRIAISQRPDVLLLTTDLEDGYRLGVGAEARSVFEFSRAFRHLLAFALVGIVLLSGLAGLVISQRLLARLKRFGRFAADVGRGDLSVRIPPDDMGDDLRPLAVTVNGMLDQISMLMDDVRYSSASIAHDLRTPLGHLRQRLEDIEARQQGEADRAECQRAIEELDGILGTFSSIMRIAELESGSLQVASEVVDLKQVLESVAEAYAPIVAEAGQHFSVELAGPAAVRGDRKLLVQLFANLVENATRHAGAGAEIHVSLHSGNGQTEVVVADTGGGISPGEREEMLKPFRRADVSRGTKGSGLGLSLVRAIADRHGAELLLEDNAPGLRVRVVFPNMSGAAPV